jgi:O-antigen/teichoic acid export membrane protein
MISFLGASFFMVILLNIKKEITVWKKDAILEKEMTSYGKSMLLYSTSSWVNNAIDRYFVLAMCGSAINGLYGVAYKIPAILIVVQRIFAQAWQMSATKNYKEEDRSLFFSSMYEAYHAIMIVGCSFLIINVRLIAKFMFAKEFFEAWVLVPPLLISVIFGALTGFLGSICLAFKDGKSMGQATGIGALVNIILNSIGIYYIGAMGAAIATMISYYVMYAVSYRKVKKHCELKIARKKDYVSYGILILQTVLIVKQISGYYVINNILFLMLLCIYGKQIWRIAKRVGER